MQFWGPLVGAFTLTALNQQITSYTEYWPMALGLILIVLLYAFPAGEGAGAPDGMKIDSEGNLYCCGPGGIHIFNKAGTCLGVINAPETVANFDWGDADRRGLFITASTSLYRIRVRTPGRPPD